MNVRFTAWLSEAERDRLDKAANEHGTSVNYLVRLAIRQYLGMPSQLSQVTNDKVGSK